MQLINVDDILWLVGDKGGIEKLVTIILYDCTGVSLRLEKVFRRPRLQVGRLRAESLGAH